MGEKIEQPVLTDEDRAEMQSHYPYMDIKLNELSVQEERLIHFFLRGMSKAAAGRAAGYADPEYVYKIFKKNKIQQAVAYFRDELREEVKFDRGVATNMYLEAHRKSVTATEECKITDSLCKLHGLHAPENATQININIEKNVEQLERLPDSELLKIAGVDNQYLIPNNGNKKD
jgi:hypothetical protein|tara:strand:+ start:122 stop:643 length:522 start_codon:yes stop_codon:yes gene_type:complete